MTTYPNKFTKLSNMTPETFDILNLSNASYNNPSITITSPTSSEVSEVTIKGVDQLRTNALPSAGKEVQTDLIYEVIKTSQEVQTDLISDSLKISQGIQTDLISNIIKTSQEVQTDLISEGINQLNLNKAVQTTPVKFIGERTSMSPTERIPGYFPIPHLEAPSNEIEIIVLAPETNSSIQEITPFDSISQRLYPLSSTTSGNSGLSVEITSAPALVGEGLSPIDSIGESSLNYSPSQNLSRLP
jgi:hypothetical protein